jgi:hypothetical protein
VWLHEKGGKQHEMPAHHLLEHYLDAYVTAAGIGADKTSPLFRTLGGRGRKQLGSLRMARQDARRMIVRRAVAAGIATKLGCHTFRATGITVYLLNCGLLEYAQQMAAHESARTTKLYDRRNDQVTLDQVRADCSLIHRHKAFAPPKHAPSISSHLRRRPATDSNRDARRAASTTLRNSTRAVAGAHGLGLPRWSGR